MNLSDGGRNFWTFCYLESHDQVKHLLKLLCDIVNYKSNLSQLLKASETSVLIPGICLQAQRIFRPQFANVKAKVNLARQSIV